MVEPVGHKNGGIGFREQGAIMGEVNRREIETPIYHTELKPFSSEENGRPCLLLAIL